ncbi:hypothetical protein AVEN_55164-1 [Araneus ventricosus]|uniref:Uncharacterized protein n=1 Tax=Araneus ventricosus TaxID=182803 RepID=A0A4Y2HLI5_ARAVE|nr:hypothetical protein AVEN_55164-1 [Araneus ventricosus]
MTVTKESNLQTELYEPMKVLMKAKMFLVVFALALMLRTKEMLKNINEGFGNEDSLRTTGEDNQDNVHVGCDDEGNNQRNDDNKRENAYEWHSFLLQTEEKEARRSAGEIDKSRDILHELDCPPRLSQNQFLGRCTQLLLHRDLLNQIRHQLVFSCLILPKQQNIAWEG